MGCSRLVEPAPKDIDPGGVNAAPAADAGAEHYWTVDYARE
ncbi:hypothetical protein [Cellulomonas sp. B6]|nr:hypothetical protein [Cellulomonas sp. B6]